MDRREFFTVSTGTILGVTTISRSTPGEQTTMYGIIGKITVVDGRRQELAEILVQAVGGLPGCLSYVVAEDADDLTSLWVTEVWDSAESHRASLSFPWVQEAVARGRPLIEEFSARYITTPLGGHGLRRAVTRRGIVGEAHLRAPRFSFSEGVPLFVDCEDQAEVDGDWDAIVAAGGTPTRYEHVVA